MNRIYYLEELGRLFAKDGCAETFYGTQFESLALRKFLISSLKNASTRINNGLTLMLVVTSNFSWWQQAVAALCENSPVSVIYHLLRRNVHDALSGNNGISKKRKLGDSN